jgi:hypothetical protein
MARNHAIVWDRKGIFLTDFLGKKQSDFFVVFLMIPLLN